MFNLEKSISEWRRQMQAAGIKTSVPLEELEIHLREDIDRLVQSGLSQETAFNISARHLGQPQALKIEFRKNGTAPGKKLALFMLVACVSMILRVLYVHHHTGPAWKGDQIGWILFSLIMLVWPASSVFFDFTLGDVREVRLRKLAAITFSVVAAWVSLSPALVLSHASPKFHAVFGMADWLLTLLAVAASFLSIFVWQYDRGVLPIISNRPARTLSGFVCCLSGPAAIALVFYLTAPQLGHIAEPLLLVIWAWTWTAAVVLAGVGYGLAEAAHKQTTLAVP